ncbi:MAG: histidine--tRNA ligase [Candidatus Sulfotelmatobacter sp.]
MIKAPRGTRDLLPPDTALWNHIESIVRDVFRAYNFHEIRTPIFEATELFARGVGEETDIVSKEMYTWWDTLSNEKSIIAAWFEKHRQELVTTHGLPSLQSGRPDLIVETENEIVAIEAKFRPDRNTLLRLYQFSKQAQDWLRPNGPKLRLVVVAPSDAPLDDWFRESAKNQGIDVETVDIDYPQSLTLRPEATAGIVRAYIEHKLWDRGLNKLYCIGPMFRRERPQKGRYRQFYQIDAEVIGPASSGSDSPARDAEILEMLATLLDRLDITDWNLELNSVGTPTDRLKFNEALRAALDPVKEKMCADCQRRAVTNPLRVFDCKVPEDQPIIDTLPRISQFLGEDSRQHFEAVQQILRAVGVDFHINDRLVRGLDYYTRTAFEFTHGALGAQNAILGGGRYDGLSEALGGPAAPGIGFAIGEDRLVLTLQEKTPAETIVRKPNVYIAPMAGMNIEAARLSRELRRKGLIVELGDENFRLKKSFEAAAKAGAKYILIVGENEIKAQAFALKNLATGEQVSVPRADLAKEIKA